MWGKEAGIKIECDFSCGFFSDNTRQVGKCGISDQLRQFHSMVYGIFVSENGVDAKLLLKYAIELASNISMTVFQIRFHQSLSLLKSTWI